MISSPWCLWFLLLDCRCLWMLCMPSFSNLFYDNLLTHLSSLTHQQFILACFLSLHWVLFLYGINWIRPTIKKTWSISASGFFYSRWILHSFSGNGVHRNSISFNLMKWNHNFHSCLDSGRLFSCLCSISFDPRNCCCHRIGNSIWE